MAWNECNKTLLKSSPKLALQDLCSCANHLVDPAELLNDPEAIALIEEVEGWPLNMKPKATSSRPVKRCICSTPSMTGSKRLMKKMARHRGTSVTSTSNACDPGRKVQILKPSAPPVPRHAKKLGGAGGRRIFPSSSNTVLIGEK